MALFSKYTLTNMENMFEVMSLDKKECDLLKIQEKRHNEIKGEFLRYTTNGMPVKDALVESQKGGEYISGNKLYLFSHKQEFAKFDGTYAPKVMEVTMKACGTVIASALDKQNNLVQAKFGYNPTSETLGKMLCGIGEPFGLIMGNGDKALDLFKSTGLNPVSLTYQINKNGNDFCPNIYKADQQDIGLVAHSNVLGPQTSVVFCENADYLDSDKDIDKMAEVSGKHVLNIISQNFNTFNNYLSECRELYDLPQFNEKVFQKIEEGPAECIPGDDEMKQ